MMQKEIMIQSEGNAWFNRNRDRLGQDDPVTHMIAAWIKRQPARVLEVGCADGWRLAKLRTLYGCQVYGVEPSQVAAMEAAGVHRVPVYQLTASCLPVVEGGFDLIIYGFCLYLTDPEDWLHIAAEGDRALAPGGHIIIHDFADFDPPRTEVYEHDKRMVSHHFDWAKLWLAHPRYEEVVTVFSKPYDRVTILRKNPK